MIGIYFIVLSSGSRKDRLKTPTVLEHNTQLQQFGDDHQIVGQSDVQVDNSSQMSCPDAAKVLKFLAKRERKEYYGVMLIHRLYFRTPPRRGHDT